MSKNREKIDVTHCNIYVINKFNGPTDEAKRMNNNKSKCILDSLVSRDDEQKLIGFFDG